MTTSALAALASMSAAARQEAVNVVAKLSANTLTVMVLRGESAQAVPLRRPAKKSLKNRLLAVLQPTFSYVEDELGRAR